MREINFSRLRSLTARRLIAALERDGFVLDRQRGSHHSYIHPDGRQVTVPFSRAGETFAIGTLRSIILTQAQWAAADLTRLGLY